MRTEPEASPPSLGQFICLGAWGQTCPCSSGTRRRRGQGWRRSGSRQRSTAQLGQALARLEPVTRAASMGTAARTGAMTDPTQDLDPEGHYQFRVIVLGDAGVGKSSLLRCFAEGPWGRPAGTASPGPTTGVELYSRTLALPPSPGPTIGVEFYSRTLALPPAGRAKLQLWDTAGQERFR